MAVSSPRPARPASTALGANLLQLRHERCMTLEALARRAGVSRAMISKVERGAAVPTATVLGKLAAGLEVGVSRLLGQQQVRQPVLLDPAMQPSYSDPRTGFTRRSLSPSFPDRHVDIAMNVLPPGQSAIFAPHRQGVEEYLFVARGELVVTVDGTRFVVGEGSTLFHRGDVVHEYRNETSEPTGFLVVVDGTGAA